MTVDRDVWTCPRCEFTIRGRAADDILAEIRRSHERRCRPRPPVQPVNVQEVNG